MLIILPIGHESNTVRRLPWVTFGIMAACFVTHLVVSTQMKGVQNALENKLREYIVYYIDHPYLEPDQQTLLRLMGKQNAQQFQQALEMLRAQSGVREIPPNVEEEQAKLDELSLDLVQTTADIPVRKLGYIPAQKKPLSLLTYMFVHSGWLHLVGNLLFLYLAAPFIEDVWGRPLFLGFYLVAGIFSALMFGWHYPQMNGPLVGASGAIAGVMGAFLLRYWKTKIEFFYLVFFIIRGTFSAPAFVMLPIWFFLELFNAGAMDIVNPGGGGSVAHWAHVWGFALGFGAALVIKNTRLEERFINPKIEAQITYVDEVTQDLENALKLKQQRRADEAFAQVLSLAQKNPGRDDVIRVLWALAVETGREAEAVGMAAAMIEREVRREQMDAAVDDYREVRRAAAGLSLSPAAKISLARQLLKVNAREEARELVVETLSHLESTAPPGLLLSTAQAAAALSPALARAAAELCLRNPEIPADMKQRLRDFLDKLPRSVS